MRYALRKKDKHIDNIHLKNTINFNQQTDLFLSIICLFFKLKVQE